MDKAQKELMLKLLEHEAGARETHYIDPLSMQLEDVEKQIQELLSRKERLLQRADEDKRLDELIQSTIDSLND